MNKHTKFLAKDLFWVYFDNNKKIMWITIFVSIMQEKRRENYYQSAVLLICENKYESVVAITYPLQTITILLKKELQNGHSILYEDNMILDEPIPDQRSVEI